MHRTVPSAIVWAVRGVGVYAYETEQFKLGDAKMRTPDRILTGHPWGRVPALEEVK